MRIPKFRTGLRGDRKAAFAGGWAKYFRSEACGPAKARLDPRELDYLAPLLGFVGHEFPEVGGRTQEHRAAQVGELHLILGSASPR